ncbi:hypothetical protein Q3O97_05935 [Ralstonia pseudosolanacearum]|uniref:hypothetical protein n=1 Tax=Ralstonia pseudosolanacearum TaxID=1310165 RepID=UPI002703315E|nr:hypothetical protein [Ralstonia pseudosolanacearum]MDO3615379.1 hypothetical protein [Ralstonia pseudosolanacearum]
MQSVSAEQTRSSNDDWEEVMTLEEYWAGCRAIHEELREIADTTLLMARAGSGTVPPDSVRLQNLMNRQNFLLDQLAKLDAPASSRESSQR